MGVEGWAIYRGGGGSAIISRMIITIDGPAGSGKSTAARNLAKALGIAFLDTGATYRAATLKAMRGGVAMDDESALAELIARADIKLICAENGAEVLLDGEDVSAEIRTAEVTDNSHYIARPPAVRDMLVQLQRRIGSELGDFVSEGRDQGSVAFPDADLKFYVDALPEIRAQRRCEEMTAAGEDVSVDEILDAIRQRDQRDRTREVGPLVKPDGAIEIDTSEFTPAQTLAKLIRHVEASR